MEYLTDEPSNRSEACLLSHAWTYQAAFLVVVMFFWLMPFFVTGMTGKPWRLFPRVLSEQHNSAALFTRSLDQVNDRHLEWKRADGSWFELEERRLFPKGIFGDDTRMDRMLRKYAKGAEGRDVALRLVRYGWERGAAIGQLGEEVIGARLVETKVEVGAPEMAHPVGAWEPGKASNYPEGQRRVLYRFDVEKGRVSFAPVLPPKPKVGAVEGAAEVQGRSEAAPPTKPPPPLSKDGTTRVRRLLNPEHKPNLEEGTKANP